MIFSKSGINAPSDLKFIQDNNDIKISKNSIAPENSFCHYDEFLPILRDKLKNQNGGVVIIGSQNIEKNHLSILSTDRESDIYILSKSQIEHKRVFKIECDDFVWIGDNLYKKEDRFVIEIKEKHYKEDIKKILEKYFTAKILEIEPKYASEQNNNIANELKSFKQKLDSFSFATQKE